ncbi:MAG: aldo/keto reductase [Bacteroidetes bacterium]|nr:aldo/keto reductase [Bacteroidota bacterium]
MKYRKFGNLGWNISEIGFGAWAIGGGWGLNDDSESLKALNKAIDLGVNFIDTAQGYGDGHSEKLIGKVLKERKEEIYVATKIPPVKGFEWPPKNNADINSAFPAKYIVEELEKSLIRLNRDYVDIYQFHTWAAKFNIEDSWFEAMNKLKDEGKIRAIGVSVPDTKPDTVIGAIEKGRIDSVQLIYNIFEQYPNWNILPVCHAHNVGVIVRVPFDEGALTGKYTLETTFPEGDVRRHYFRGNNLKAVVKKVNEIKSYKEKYHKNYSMAELALKFCLSNNTVSSVIPGIRSITQAEINTSVSDGKYLSDDQLKYLEKFEWQKDFWFEEVSNI